MGRRKRSILPSSRQLSLPSILPGLGVTSLALPATLSLSKYGQVGQALKTLVKSVRWAIGDWLAYGEQRFSAEYAQFADGLDPDEASRLIRVSLRVPPENRRADLAWSHHRVVAGLEPAEQKGWLAKAARGHWSAKELREHLKAEDGEAPTPRSGTGMSCCTGCGCEGKKKTPDCCKPKNGQEPQGEGE